MARRGLLIVAATALMLGSVLPCECALASPDCSSPPAVASGTEPAVGAHSGSLSGASLRSALHGTVGTSGTASSEASCHRGQGALLSMASALLPRSYSARPLIDGYSVSAATGTVAREMPIEPNPHVANSPGAGTEATTASSLERESGMEARFGVRWQSLPGPAWAQYIPSWVIQDAKTYHRRGLPVLHLWESSNYLVALGLSNHGVPGIYFSQKLP
jgi:hypothetical protein